MAAPQLDSYDLVPLVMIPKEPPGVMQEQGTTEKEMVLPSQSRMWPEPEQSLKVAVLRQQDFRNQFKQEFDE